MVCTRSGFCRCIITAVLACLLTEAFAIGANESGYLELPEITITAEKLELSDHLQLSAEELPSHTLELRYAPSPNEAMRLNPSVSLPGSMKGMAAAPSIRGFPNYSNQILIDGTPVTMPWSNWANITAFPLRNLKKVTVVKGGDSIVYGTGGLSGAINMGLPTAKDMSGLRLYQEYGNQSTDHRELFYGRSTESNDHLFGYVSDYSSGYQRHSMKESESIFYKGSVRTDSNWNFRLSILELQGRFDLPDLGDVTMTPQIWDRWDFSHRDLVAEKTLSQNRQLTLRLYRNAEDYTTIDYADYTYAKETGRSSTRMAVDGCEAIYNFSLGSKHRLAFGYQGKQEYQNGVSVGGIRRSLTTSGLFISDRVRVSDSTDLRLNLRRDEHSAAGAETSWSAGIDWKTTDKCTIALTRSRLTRFPTMRELYMAFIGTQNASGAWSASIPGQGDEGNNAEIADTIDVSCSYKIDDFWNISLTRFDSKVSDLIDRVYNPAWPKQKPRFWWRNVSEVDIAGWEARMEGSWGKHWHFWAGYTRQEDVNDTATGKRLDEKPQYKINSGLVWNNRKTSALLTFERRGVAPYVATSKNLTQNLNIASGNRFDLVLRHRLTPLISTTLSIDNITDSEIESSSHVIGTLPVYETPRKATLGLECRF